MNNAELCRKNGWTVGDILEGQEGPNTDRIRITAIGEYNILARRRWSDASGWDLEKVWTLEYRDWKKVST